LSVINFLTSIKLSFKPYDFMLLLKWIFKSWGVIVPDVTGSRCWPVMDCCEHGNKVSRSVIGNKILTTWAITSFPRRTSIPLGLVS